MFKDKEDLSEQPVQGRGCSLYEALCWDSEELNSVPSFAFGLLTMLGKSLSVSVPQFLPLLNGDNDSDLLWKAR